MKKILTTVLVTSFIFLTAQAQHADCIGAIPICDTLVDLPVFPNDTQANPLEINTGLSCLANGEVQGQWYKFGVNSTGNLRFTITPYDTLRDFDWALFRVDWGNCEDIFGMPSYEISCDFSGIGGGHYTTGADGLTTPGHRPAVNVTTPALFYLYITLSQADTNAVQGYTIDFSQSDFLLTDCMEIGIQENEAAHGFKIYPNPVTDYATLQFKNTIDAGTLVVYDMHGRQVYTQKTAAGTEMISINTLGWLTGMYMVQYQTGNNIVTRRLIKS